MSRPADGLYIENTGTSIEGEKMSERTCTNCSKPQSELSNPLKFCAKCHTQSYCSRDCQKEHWKVHKRTCGKVPAEPTPGSLSNPPKEEISAGASETIELMKALARCRGFNYVLRDMEPSVAGLMYLADFVSKTFREYWYELLPQRKATDLMMNAAVFFGKDEAEERKALDERLEALEKEKPEMTATLDKWPDRVDSEKYEDALGRNIMAANIVVDRSKQPMMGGVYDYPEEVKLLARRILRS